MTLSDTLDYITSGNPVNRMVFSTGSALLRIMGLRPKHITHMDSVMPIQSSIHQYVHPHGSLYSLSGSHYHFLRLAGIGGASAIFMGAYCKYMLKDIGDPKEQVDLQAFAEVANRIHILHSFALMAMPLSHFPVLTGTLMVAGTALFSGCMYYRALTGEKRLQPYATGGGFCLIAAWLSLIF